MFDSLSDRLQGAIKRIKGNHQLSEKHIDEMMREVRLSLLEADVNFRVVKAFIREVKEKALGEKVLKGLNPSEQVVKVVHDELKKLMGDEAEPLNLNKNGISTIMMVGLQGAGKTTHVGKLGLYLRKKEKRNPLFIAADIYRPAAINQLVTIGKQLNIPVFEMGTKKKAVDIVKKGLEYAKENDHDLVIIDTAGRLHIDEALMGELVDVKKAVDPNEILLTIDAMTGQDAVNVAKSFHELLQVTGCLLTKLDGDTRGGAALSVRHVTGVPIKFMGLGEKLDQLEVFHPERMAGRILGMGDIVSLVEKVSESIDEEEQMKMVEKMMAGKMNYNDLKKQLKTIKRIGSFSSILRLIPGMGGIRKQLKENKGQIEDQLEFVGIMISSMTEEERRKPNLISSSSSRRQRIARGSGKKVSDVNKLIDMLEQQKQMMKKMQGMDPSKLEQMSKGNMNPQELMAPKKAKKGKGKGKGGFRR